MTRPTETPAHLAPLAAKLREETDEAVEKFFTQVNDSIAYNMRMGVPSENLGHLHEVSKVAGAEMLRRKG